MSVDLVGWHPEVLLCFAAGLEEHADVFCIEFVSVMHVDTELNSCITTPFVVGANGDKMTFLISCLCYRKRVSTQGELKQLSVIQSKTLVM